MREQLLILDHGLLLFVILDGGDCWLSDKMAQAYKEIWKHGRLPLQNGRSAVLAKYGQLRGAWVMFARRTCKALACGSVFQVCSVFVPRILGRNADLRL